MASTTDAVFFRHANTFERYQRFYVDYKDPSLGVKWGSEVAQGFPVLTQREG